MEKDKDVLSPERRARALVHVRHLETNIPGSIGTEILATIAAALSSQPVTPGEEVEDRSDWKPRKYVSTTTSASESAAYVAKLQKSNPAYWTTEKVIETLYAHRENCMADIENALAKEWPEAQREVIEGGNYGWGMIARTAIAALRVTPGDAGTAERLEKVQRWDWDADGMTPNIKGVWVYFADVDQALEAPSSSDSTKENK